LERLPSETAVHEVSTKLGALLRRVEWSADRHRARLDGVGCWIELRIDAEAVHVTCDAPMLGRLLGVPVGSPLKHMIEGTFQKKLP
jgi:hypothetical protein